MNAASDRSLCLRKLAHPFADAGGAPEEPRLQAFARGRARFRRGGLE